MRPSAALHVTPLVAGLLAAAVVSAPARLSAQGAEAPAAPILYVDAPRGVFELRAIGADGRRVGVRPQTMAGVPAWDPRGEWMALVEGDELVRVTLEGRREVLARAASGESFTPALDWAPDGGALAAVAVGDGARLVVVDGVGGGVRAAYELPDGLDLVSEKLDLQWSPGGDRVLVRGERLRVVDVTDGTVQAFAEEPVEAVWLPSGDGLLVLRGGAAADGGTLDVVDRIDLVPLEGEPSIVVARDGLGALGLAEVPLLQAGMELSPGAWRLAVWGYTGGGDVAAFRSRIHVYEVDAGSFDLAAPSATVEVPGRWVVALRWSPDERLLAAALASPDELVIAVVDPATGAVRELAAPAVSADVAWMYVLVRSFLGWSH